MVVLDQNTFQLGGREYVPLRDDIAREMGVRRWKVEPKPQATTRVARPDVRPGEIDGTWIISYTDFSRGVAGELEQLPGTIHFTEGVHGTSGSLRPLLSPRAGGYYTSLDEVAPPCAVFLFNETPFCMTGREAKLWQLGAWASDEDFGATIAIQCAVVHNSEIVVGFGGSTTKIYVRNTAGTWTQATDATYADLLARVKNRLWRITATNQASNIGPADNPRTLLNWSAGIVVGDPTTGCTAAAGYLIRLAVAKPEGLFLGEEGAQFENVLPNLESTPSPENGRGMIVRGSDIFYPWRHGLIRYHQGVAEDVTIPSGGGESADEAPSRRVLALAAAGHHIWAMTSPSGYPRALLTQALKTTDNGASYTDIGAALSDGTAVSGATIYSLDTLANGDWVLIGYNATFGGLYLEIYNPNLNAATLTVQYSTGAGTWGSFDVGSVWDETSPATSAAPLTPGTKTLSVTGLILWPELGLAATPWVSATYDGKSAFYVRLSVSAALSSGAEIGEARIVTTIPTSHLWRGRPPKPGDVRSSSIIWEPITAMTDLRAASVYGVIRPTALALLPGALFGMPELAVVVAAKQERLQYSYTADPFSDTSQPTTGPLNTRGRKAVLPKHDGGSPVRNKVFTRIVVHGRRIDGNRDISIDYRTDEATAWTSAGAVTASPTTLTLTSVTGRWIQLRVNFGTFSSYPPAEVTTIEVTYHDLDTWKNDYTLYCEVGPGQRVESDVQMTLLRALRGTSTTLLDADRTSKTVIVREVLETEIRQPGLEYPTYAVGIRCSEV